MNEDKKITKKKNNNESKLVSVIVPVYNTGQILYRCLDSLLNQSYDNYEIIIIDDGSNDETKKILSEYKTYSKIRIFTMGNSGPSKARNLGIEKSRGHFIMFCDSDDKVHKDWIKELASTCNPLSICGYEMFVNNEIYVNKSSNNERVKISKAVKLLTHSNCFLCPYVWDKCFVASIIKNNKINFDLNINFAEDICFVVDYLSNLPKDCDVSFIDKVLYFYCPQQKGLTRSASNDSIILSTKEIYNYCNNRKDVKPIAEWWKHFMLMAIVLKSAYSRTDDWKLVNLGHKRIFYMGSLAAISSWKQAFIFCVFPKLIFIQYVKFSNWLYKVIIKKVKNNF